MKHSLHVFALLAAVVLAIQVASPAWAEIEGRYRIEPQLPPDVLGLYVFLPAGV